MAAVKQIDAISSFQHIIDNIPQWKTQITEISIYAAGKYDEFVAEYSRLVHQTKAKKKKTTSITSLHTSDYKKKELDKGQTILKSPEPSSLVELNPLEAGNRFIYAQAHRKRKPGTSLRSNASELRNVRSKHMVVIFYDSHIQAELDKLVKAFGAARNNLRKGKNAYNAAKGFSLPGLSRRYDTMENLVPNLISRSSPRLPKTKSETAVTNTNTKPSSPEAAFASTDQALEHTQSLCETAAHQVIRDGDCQTELAEATKQIELLSVLVNSALDMLKVERQKTQAEEALREENANMIESASSQSTLYEKSSFEAIVVPRKIPLPVLGSFDVVKGPIPSTLASPLNATMLADAIEVDDDDDDDDATSISLGLDISAYRAAGRRAIA